MDFPPFVVSNFFELFTSQDDLQSGDAIHILYHACCLDGAASAVVAKSLFNQVESALCINLDISLHQVSYATPPPVLDKPGHVFIVDFSYAPEVLEELNGRHCSVTVIDHHQTAIKAIVDANEATPVGFAYILSDDRLKAKDVLGHSGGSLTAWVLPMILAPLMTAAPMLNSQLGCFVQLAREHDLWAHGGDIESDALALSYWFNTLKADDTLIDYILSEINDQGTFNLVAEGRANLREKLLHITENIMPLVQKFVVCGHLVPVCACPKIFGSLTATLLNKDQPFSVTYAKIGDHIEYSLRASDASDINVAVLAESYKGGGHVKAAGFISQLLPAELFQAAP